MTAETESHRKDTRTVCREPERIAKAIARSGLCSRRDAEALIAAGRVTVNGAVLQSAALDVSADDAVLVDGRPLSEREPPRLWRYHKPKGRVTTHKDPQGRPTVFDDLPEGLPRLISVGRLDFNTEGLLLLTNDGDLARHLEMPSTAWARRYRVRAHGAVEQGRLDALAEGIVIDKVRYGPVEATLEREQGDNVWINLTLREGKNREVRRIMEHLGLTVNRLIRVSFGPFMLGDLQPGEVDEVKVSVLREQLGTKLSSQLGLRRGPVRESRKLPPKRAKPTYLRRKPATAVAESKEPAKPETARRLRRILSPDGKEAPRVEEMPMERARPRGRAAAYSNSGGRRAGGGSERGDKKRASLAPATTAGAEESRPSARPPGRSTGEKPSDAAVFRGRAFKRTRGPAAGAAREPSLDRGNRQEFPKRRRNDTENEARSGHFGRSSDRGDRAKTQRRTPNRDAAAEPNGVSSRSRASKFVRRHKAAGEGQEANKRGDHKTVRPGGRHFRRGKKP